MIWKPHATVAAVICREQRFLVVEENIDDQLVYNQPAGHLEDDEELVDAVVREVREETAWRFTPSALIGIYRWRNPANATTHMRVTFTGQVDDHRPAAALDDGIVAAHWLTREQLAARDRRLRSPLVLTCIDDYLSGRSYPLDLLRSVS